MPIVTIKLEEEEYKELKERATRAGYKSVAEYVKSLLAEGKKEEIPPQLVRTVQDMINPFTAKIDELARSYGELREKLETMESRLREIEENLRARRSTRTTVMQPRRTARRSAIDRLREEGVVFQDDLSWLNNPKAFFNKLRREGAVVIDEEEMIAVDPQYWEEFVSEVRRIKIEDPSEAEKELSGKKRILFRRLVDKGKIFYDKLEGRWSVSV